MSRFSKAEAEARGWAFTHAQPATIEDLGDGITRSTPASYRAEKSRPGGMVTEEGETIGLLLERIHSWERLQDSLPSPATGPTILETRYEFDPETRGFVTNVYDASGDIVAPEPGAEKFARDDIEEPEIAFEDKAPAEVRSEAAEAKAKEIRDDHETQSGDDGLAVSKAAGKAEQEHADVLAKRDDDNEVVFEPADELVEKLNAPESDEK
jgi:hypothetical protein